MRWIAALALAMLATQSPTGSDQGRIVGVIREPGGAAIPGATITLRSAELERRAVADSRGNFSFDALPAGRYDVIATLVGFRDRSQPGVVVRRGETVSLEFRLDLDCLAIIDYVDMALPWVAAQADVIAHIRIQRVAIPDACAVSTHCSCTLQHAVVRATAKGPSLREIRLVQEGAGRATEERPYEPGDEFIAFLRRDDANFAFARVAGPHYMFRVRNGRVEFKRTGAPGLHDGMPVDEFLKALQAIGR